MTTLPPPGSDAPADAATDPAATAPPRRRSSRCRLSGGYRWVLGAGWVLLVAAMGTLARSTQLVGDPAWWLDWWLPLAVLPLAVVTAVLVDLPGPLVLSSLAALELLAIGLVDLAGGRPYLGAFEIAMAVSGFLLTLACRAGRQPRRTKVETAPAPAG